MENRRQPAPERELQKSQNQDSNLCPPVAREMFAAELWSLLGLKDLGSLSFSCKFFDNLTEFQSLLMKRTADNIVFNPNPKKIKKILDVAKEANPAFFKKLLQAKIPKVINRHGQIIPDRTLLQLAFGEGDDEMCLLFKPYFEYAFASNNAAETEIQKQLDEKFTKETLEENDQINTKFTTLLRAVIQAITNEQFNHGEDADEKWVLNSATLEAIKTFRNGLNALLPKVINKGMHCPLNAAQKTFNAYLDAAQHWGYNNKRCALFEDGVLSSTLKTLPANDAQRCSQGLYFLQPRMKEEFFRKLTLRNSDKKFYDHLDSPSANFSSLKGSCINIVNADPISRRNQARVYVGILDNEIGVELENLYQIKYSNLQNIFSQRDIKSQHLPPIR